MAAPLSSGIGTGAAQVYSGTMAYDALKDIIQQQRIQREKKEAKEEKKRLKAEKEQKEQEAYIRNELRGIIPRDAKIFSSRDRQKLTTDLMGRAQDMLSEPGFAQRLYEGDVDAVVRWEEFMGEAAGTIQKSVDDKVLAAEIQQEYDRYKADPENYDGDFYPEDLERFGTESTTPLSNISALDKRIDYNKTLDDYIANQWSLWSTIQKEEQGTSEKGWEMTDQKATEIVDNFYNDPTNVKALRHKIKSSNPQLTDEEVDAMILQERDQQLADVKKWTTKQKIYRGSSGMSLSDLNKLEQIQSSEDWMENYWYTPLSGGYATTEADYAEEGLIIPRMARDPETGEIVIMKKEDGTPLRTTVPAAFPGILQEGKILKNTPQSKQMEAALRSAGIKYRVMFPFELNDGRRVMGYIDDKNSFQYADPKNYADIVFNSSYVKKFKQAPGGNQTGGGQAP